MSSPDGTLTSPPVTLLELEHGGRLWLVSTDTVDIQDEDGRWRHYEGLLSECDVYQEAIPFSFEVAGRIDCEAYMPGSFAALQGEGEDPGLLTGEVAQWRRGDAWESRERIVQGRVVVQSWGSATEPVRMSISPQDPADDQSVWPPPSQIISDQTWNTPVPSARDHDEDTVGGRAYPTVFGKAGLLHKRAGIATVAAVPAYPVIAANPVLVMKTPFHDAAGKQIIISDGNPPGPSWTAWCVIAGHWIWPQLEPGTSDYRVTLHGADGSSEWAYLYFCTDALGQVVALAGKNAFTPGTGLYSGAGIVAGNAYWCSFDNGAMGNLDMSGPMTDAGELLRWVLERAGSPVDWRRTGAVLRQLSAYILAGYWDASVGPWPWASDNLRPLLPISIRPGPDGVFPVVWNFRATAKDAVAHLVDGLNCTLEGEPVQDGEEDVISSSSIEYATSKRTSASYGHKTWGGAELPTGAHETASLHTRRAGLSLQSQLEPRVEALTTDLVCGDAQTADLVMAWRTQVYSKTWTYLHAVSDGLHHRGELSKREPGDVVTVTSARLGYVRRVAHVTRPGWVGALCYNDLVIFPEP